MYGEGGNLHCQEGNLPSYTHSQTLSPLNANHPGLQCVFDAPPMDPSPHTDAQRMTRGCCGLKQRMSAVQHTDTKRRLTQCWWKNGRTDASLLCWLTTGSRHEAAVNQWKGRLYDFRTCLSGPEEPSTKVGEDKKHSVFPPLCTERWERCRISKWSQGWRGTQPSALHPSVAWSSASGLYIFDMIILVQVFHFDQLFLDLTDTNMWNTNALFEKKKKTLNMSDFLVQGLYRNSWLRFNMFTFSVPLHFLDKPK